MKYSLDTNTITALLRKQPNVIANMERAIDNCDEIFISSIVYYEISRWLRFAGHPKQLKTFEDLYRNSPHLELDRRAIEKSIEIYDQLRRGQNVEDADIFIAAIAIVNDCTLVSANEKHFGRIEGLRWINWRV